MEGKRKKSVQHWMRSLHRDIGYLMIGMTLIYAISGIVLVYRDTEFLKSEKTVTRQLEPNLAPEQIGMMLHLRFFKVEKTEGDLVYFGNGTYNKATGETIYQSVSLPEFLNKINGLHKASSQSKTHWFTTVFGLLMLFLALSSLWMFKARSKHFKRGMVFSVLGLALAVVMLIL
ncbi:PepSY-associated TM helix domain-containing protein [uncultured Draconibacterium sp.]|uniref:PepSY-associated TM helix domain-containing protein n=1 Tax=uncultured Draconibacterium sp. TaxID=1573823 RepID=UPI002AA95A2E|nr:PepSY-associated TM helix domain-containing protein [uncultured Draconibacterium sp.]